MHKKCPSVIMNLQFYHYTFMKTTKAGLRSLSSFGHKNPVDIIISGNMELTTRQLLLPKRDKYKLRRGRGKENK